MPGMRILAVDSTGPNGSIAVLNDEELQGFAGFTTPRGHAQKLLPELDRLFESIGSSLAEIDGFAVAVGPGSFTGLRIGIASVEGLAFATGRPVVGVSTLEATAYRHRSGEGLVAVVLDARRGEIFGALYRAEGAAVTAVMDPVCESLEIFLARLPSEPIRFAGSGLEMYGATIRQIVGERAHLTEPFTFLAEEVARIGKRLHEEGRGVPLGGLQALYLRLSDAEQARREKAGKSR
jgi:tRNA threonylcarbamoyladenosine biosynthesis protein TsaB